MKNIYRYLIVILILIVVLVSIVTYRYEIIDRMSLLRENNYLTIEEGTLIDDKDEIKVTQRIEFKRKEPFNVRYKAEDEEEDLFSLSYGNDKLNAGDILKKADVPYVYDQLNLIFKKTYPMISLDEMGVESEEDAYWVKQLAIWEVAWRTGESKYGSELSYIDSIRNDVKLKDETIFRKAQELVRYVENFNYEEKQEVDGVPTLNLYTEDAADPFYDNGGYIVGPYRYTVTAANLEYCEVTALDENGNDVGAQILESNGKIKYKFSAEDEFYVKCPDAETDLVITVKADVKRIHAVIFESESGDDYLINVGIDNHMEQDTKIHWIT